MGAPTRSGGRILDYTLANGTVTARVRGSINPYFGVYKEPLYKTSITIKAITAADWTKVIRQIASRADLVTKLLMNEMPDTIEDAFSEPGLHLLPHSQRDFVTDVFVSRLREPLQAHCRSLLPAGVCLGPRSFLDVRVAGIVQRRPACRTGADRLWGKS